MTQLELLDLIIREAVECACQFVNDMSLDDPSILTVESLKYHSLLMYCNVVGIQNEQVDVIEQHVKDKINDLITQKVGFAILVFN